MVKEVWVNEGIGDDNPVKVELPSDQTVGQFKDRYARKLGVSPSEIEVTTGTKTLRNSKAKINELVKADDTLFVVPRAKAGVF